MNLAARHLGAFQRKQAALGGLHMRRTAATFAPCMALAPIPDRRL
jgi:hypothetical protein